jgi:hypothetical protein
MSFQTKARLDLLRTKEDPEGRVGRDRKGMANGDVGPESDVEGVRLQGAIGTGSLETDTVDHLLTDHKVRPRLPNLESPNVRRHIQCRPSIDSDRVLDLPGIEKTLCVALSVSF